MKVTVTAPSRVDYKVNGGGGAVSKAFALLTQEFEFNSQYASSQARQRVTPLQAGGNRDVPGAH